MVEFVNEQVSVEARVREDGSALPLAFVWRERRYQIESWGRESSKVEDEHHIHCYLVQSAGAETWELCRDTQTAQWSLTRHWAGKYRIV